MGVRGVTRKNGSEKLPTWVWGVVLIATDRVVEEPGPTTRTTFLGAHRSSRRSHSEDTFHRETRRLFAAAATGDPLFKELWAASKNATKGKWNFQGIFKITLQNTRP
jgi:hypothetical protein